MMNRREALLGMTAAALAASRVLGEPITQTNNAAEEQLRKDIDHLSPHVNSEEGIPVFLACVNLVGNKAASASVPPFSAAVVAEFRRDAAVWERILPNSPETDVGKLIEVLAYRDFSSRGMEPAS